MKVKRSSIITTNNGLPSEQLHLYYLKNFISACRLSMQQVYTTDKGAITQIPYISMADVVTGKKPPKISPEVRMRNYERYLASIHCFVVNFATGSAFVEVQNPIQDITGFMMDKNRYYKCQACGADGKSNDDIDHTGGKCQMCGKDKMVRANPVDIKANLTRIQALLDYVKETK